MWLFLKQKWKSSLYNISHTNFQQQFFNFQHVNYARNLIFLVCGLRFLKQFSRISFADLKKKISPKKRTMLFKCLKKTRVLLVYHIFFSQKVYLQFDQNLGLNLFLIHSSYLLLPIITLWFKILNYLYTSMLNISSKVTFFLVL